MREHLLFTSRDEFRSWLENNCVSSGGVWLLFGKSGGPKTIKANEALEEALCFGWIDGQMQGRILTLRRTQAVINAYHG